ncbi:NAD(P)-binding protein [Teratosphaeria nubilosa]|uniref:NAD(P)-binding protein n=1 Tax=Teratosphaeria nubilosa TaxID=161662 RepID=A0A6G1KV96_9PEZI|nr:NAD(P)-binding protein [Teratosphaeria nubilosa]
MGLAVAEALSERGGWKVHIFDLNEDSGKEVASKLPNTVFHKTDVADYAAQASAFKSAFLSSGRRLDFVFANAGVIEKKNFYAKHETDDDEPPPSPNLLSIDVDLKGVVYTAYLALHYFRQSPKEGRDASLVLTASCGSLYPADYSPMYTAAKHGVLGFLRSIASHCRLDDIRANAICPGIVETNLVGPGGWSNFPRDLFTPVSKIVDVVLQLIDGTDLLDANGVQVPAEKAYGQAVEINLDKHYIRTVPDFCDDAMKGIMEATSVENQKGGVIKD